MAKVVAHTANKTGGPRETVHMSLTKVVNAPEKGVQYAFAITDDGRAAFLSRSIVVKEKLTPLDEGAGFSAPVVEPTRYDSTDKGRLVVCLPIKWDGEAVEIEVPETTKSQEATDWVPANEFDELAELADDIMTTAKQTLTEVSTVMMSVKALDVRIAATLTELKNLKEKLDRLAPPID